MKVLYSGTLYVTAGGPALSSYNTLKGLRNVGVDAEIFMQKEPDNRLVGTDIPVKYTSEPIDHKFLYSPSFKKNLKNCGEYDIYHAQGIWQYPTYAMVDVAKSRNRPYLITPRGMLYPQDIAKSSTIFKKLSLKWRLLRDLNQAACVHVTCKDEMLHCRNLGVTAPIAVIPNPIEIKTYDSTKKDNIFRLGYLGRISPRKNVQALIYAWADLKLDTSKSELLIIGGGDDVYEKFLRDEVKRLKLTNVRFTGFVSGQVKEDALSSLSVLAMPSEFENLGNVILEGLVRGIPCIATQGAPWEELNSRHCGWWVEYSQHTITHAVELASKTSEEELKQMGANGRKLMEECYSIESVATRMKDLYEWILGTDSEKPNFVNL